MYSLMIAINDLIDAKEALCEQFLEFVRNKEVAISDRLMLWEKYAELFLPTGSWLSDAPEWLREGASDQGRNSLIHFTDLLEQLSEEDVNEDEDGHIISITKVGLEKLEEVFATGLAGTYYDW